MCGWVYRRRFSPISTFSCYNPWLSYRFISRFWELTNFDLEFQPKHAKIPNLYNVHPWIILCWFIISNISSVISTFIGLWLFPLVPFQPILRYDGSLSKIRIFLHLDSVFSFKKCKIFYYDINGVLTDTSWWVLVRELSQL